MAYLARDKCQSELFFLISTRFADVMQVRPVLTLSPENNQDSFLLADDVFRVVVESRQICLSWPCVGWPMNGSLVWGPWLLDACMCGISIDKTLPVENLFLFCGLCVCR